MGRLIKFLLWLLGGFVTLLLVAVIAVSLLFDPNDYREEIAAEVKSQTGRDLTIEGDIGLELFPWLALEVGRTSLGNAPGFGDEPMLAFERASFSVRILPAVLRQEIEIGTASIEGLRVNLMIDANGSDNWSDLASGESEAAPEAASESSTKINAESIRVDDAELRYTDATTGDAVLLEGMNLEVGRLSVDGSPVPLQAGLSFDVQPAGLSGSLELDTTVQFNSASGLLVLDGLALEGLVEGVANIPTSVGLKTDGIEVETRESRVSMETLELTGLDMRIVADVEPLSYAGEVLPKAAITIDAFSPRTLMTLFDVQPPETADPSALSMVAVEANAALSTTAMALRDVVIKLDDTRFEGFLSVPRTDAGAIEFELVGDSIQLARYMAPGEETANTGEAAPVEIPVDLLRPLKAKGRFELQRASLGNMHFDNIEVALNAGAGKLRIFPVSSDLFGGSYNGDVRIDSSAAVPVLSVDEKIEGVDLAELASAMFGVDNVSGAIEGAFKLSGSGADTLAMQESLRGTMAISLSDGAFLGTDVWHQLRRARATLKGEPVPEPVLPAKTDFNNLRMTGVVTEGVLDSQDVFLELPFMQITGGGQVDIPAATVNFGLSARVLERPEFVESATPEEIEDFTELVVPLKVTGPLASPSVRPDVEKLLQDRVEEEIKDQLKDKLKGLFD